MCEVQYRFPSPASSIFSHQAASQPCRPLRFGRDPGPSSSLIAIASTRTSPEHLGASSATCTFPIHLTPPPLASRPDAMSCDLSAQRGDVASSNDEAAVNFVARQSGAAAKSDISPRLGPAPAMESDVEEVAMNALAAFNAGRRRSSTPLVGARASVGFTSVNGRQSQSQTEVVEMQEEVDEVMHPDEDEEEGRDEMVVERQISLAPVVPRVSMVVDGEEVVDMTAGEDVVRRVLEDVTDTNGGVAYRVQFEDESVETVSLKVIFLTPAHALDPTPDERPMWTDRHAHGTGSLTARLAPHLFTALHLIALGRNRHWPSL